MLPMPTHSWLCWIETTGTMKHVWPLAARSLIIGSKQLASDNCLKCGSDQFGIWTSTSTGRQSRYCRPCRQERAALYSQRKAANGGRHTKRQWLDKLAQYVLCPGCGCKWEEIPLRPDKRYRFVWTKDHIVPLSAGGSDNIENIQPLCYRCNSSKCNGR